MGTGYSHGYYRVLTWRIDDRACQVLTYGQLTIRWSRRGGPPPYRGQSCALAAPQLKLRR